MTTTSICSSKRPGTNDRSRRGTGVFRRIILVLKPFAVLLVLALADGEAYAQALGSVHCKASLRQIEIDLKATERKLQSVLNDTTEVKCSAMNVHVLTLERAAVIFGSCTEGRARDENVGQAEGSAADLRHLMAKTCG